MPKALLARHEPVTMMEVLHLPLLQVGMMVVTAIYAVANFIAELLYAALNPRIRVAGATA